MPRALIFNYQAFPDCWRCLKSERCGGGFGRHGREKGRGGPLSRVMKSREAVTDIYWLRSCMRALDSNRL